MDKEKEIVFDFANMINRVRPGAIERELLVRAAKPVRMLSGKANDNPELASDGIELTAIDMTAGTGRDAMILAASGYRITMYEREPLIACALEDAIARARDIPELSRIAENMTLYKEDSIIALQELAERDALSPDLVYIDPMFPDDGKSALSKKALEAIKAVQTGQADEEALIKAAIAVHPAKIIIKRPAKGAYLAGITPTYSISGKLIRYDCIVR